MAQVGEELAFGEEALRELAEPDAGAKNLDCHPLIEGLGTFGVEMGFQWFVWCSAHQRLLGL